MLSLVATLYCSFCPKIQLLLPTNYERTGLVFSQSGANIHWSVPTSLLHPTINLYQSVVDLINFRSLVEPGLDPHIRVCPHQPQYFPHNKQYLHQPQYCPYTK